MYIARNSYSFKLVQPSYFVRMYEKNNQTQLEIFAHYTYEVLLLVTKRAANPKGRL